MAGLQTARLREISMSTKDNGAEIREIHWSHCVKSVEIRSFFWSVFSCIQSKYRKYGAEITAYLDTFHAVSVRITGAIFQIKPYKCLVLLHVKYMMKNSYL